MFRTLIQEVETTIVTASVTTPESGGQIHMVIDITQDTPEKLPRTYRKEHQISSVGGKGDVLHGRCGSSDVS